jgi:hypothetical protein
MQEGEQTAAGDEDSNPFITLGTLIYDGVPIQSLVTAIEKSGIYTIDRFDLYVHANDEGKARAVDLLAKEYEWRKDHWSEWQDPEAECMDMSPLDYGYANKRSGDPTDTYNPYDDYGWPESSLPNFKIDEGAQGALPGKVKRRAPDTFVAAFVRLLVEIAKRDSTINIDEMPGTKADLHAVAIKFNDRLDCSVATFDTYIEGLCKFKRGSKSGDYYKDLFPKYFK